MSRNLQPASESSNSATAAEIVPVSLGDRSYNIEIATGSLSSAVQRVRDELDDLSHVLMIMDEAVAAPWGAKLQADCRQAGIRVDAIELASGEPTKSIEQLAKLWTWMLESGCDRRSVVVAVGGGVVGDLAGFAAASFTRGIRFVQVPTTLLAMVDSSVGGKTGINLPGAKNMVGAFWQPASVLIDTEVLGTLPKRSYLSGLAEVVKYGVIDDDQFFDWLAANAAPLVAREPAAVRYAIRRSCESKARVVGEDERETSGRRATLNYGHTFAHAIEATAGYGTLLHGEAVSIGMQMAARLAIKMGLCDDKVLQRQTELLQACELPVVFGDARTDEMLAAMMRDKKVAHGKLRFILPTKIGAVQFVSDAPEALVRESITESITESM